MKIEELSLLGVFLDHGHWRIERDKERGACAAYLAGLHKYVKTKNDFYLMFKNKNSFKPPEESDIWKWIGKLALTIAAGIILSRFGIRLPDNLKL